MSDLASKLEGLDTGGQLDDVLAMPDHLRDALWRVESADLDPVDCKGLIVCGMGGSAIGADLAREALGDRAGIPFGVSRSYALPSWAHMDTAVLCSSYSGNTEETIGGYAAAEATGSSRIVATTGGALADAARADGVPVIPMPANLQPRAAVGYTFTIAAEVAALCGVGPAIRTEIDSSAAHLEAAAERLVEQAGDIAAQLEGSFPVIYGGGLTTPVAYRWKCQVNENAKLPSFSHEIPEMDHNEIVGWEGAPKDAFSAIMLEDRDQHPRTRQRFDLTSDLIDANAKAVVRLETEGETRTERLLWAVMLGDLISLHMAADRGVDPSPVPVIESLKDQLGRP